MNTAENYRLNEAKQQSRLEEFRKSENLAGLEREIALARVLLESATNANNLVLVRDLLATIGTLVKAHRVQRERDGELLDKTAVSQLGRQIVDILAEEFGDVPDFADRMDRTAERLCGAIAAARNQTEE